MLAAASPDFLKNALSGKDMYYVGIVPQLKETKIYVAFNSILHFLILDLCSGESDPDQLLCLHLPDYTSTEVGPVMSLLYYGEVWLCEAYVSVCQVQPIYPYLVLNYASAGP